jgi:tRNA1(Val) A37 N6-methylase TrmN6
LQQFKIIKGDVRSFLEHVKDTAFQVIVSNPPYTKWKDREAKPFRLKLIARSELSLDLSSCLFMPLNF